MTLQAENLRKKALQRCEDRGHTMEPFVILVSGMNHSKCGVCGAKVWEDPNPLPNELEIYGEAVSVNCNRR